MSGRRPPLRWSVQAALLLLGLGVGASFVSLGVWQLHRLAWKQALIARVDAALAAPPVAAPGPAQWAALRDDAAYRRVRLRGQFDHARETCTQAVTRLGPGCWVLTPLQTDQGWWVLVNRGFVPPEQRDPRSRMGGQIGGWVTVEGLLRLSEPGGGFLRRNDPTAGRWYSRDVAAIARARGLPAAAVAPYFVDTRETVPGGPMGGLTVTQFRNQHRQYALTWFALAALTFGAVGWLLREEWRKRRVASAA